MSETKKRNVKVVESKTLSSRYDKRFVVVDEETGNVLDDAQGYGYKNKQKAMAAWSYKNRDKSKDAEKRKKQRVIKAWLKEHPVVGDALEEAAWDIVKRNVPPETKIDTKLVKSILKENNLELEGFSARDLLSVWKKELMKKADLKVCFFMWERRN